MIKKLILALLLLLNTTLYAADTKGDFTILMPINHMGEKKTSLSVAIDKSYKSLQTLPNRLMEFIPEGEDASKWSQIITLTINVNIKTPASKFLDVLKTKMGSLSKNFKILEENTSDMGSYEVASFGAVYELGDRREVVYMRYYSGPADLSGIQYAKLLGPNDSPEVVLKELKAFVDKISQIITG